MRDLEVILSNFPIEISNKIKSMPKDILNNIEEIRIRIGNDIMILAGGKEYELFNGNKSKIDKDQLNNLLNAVLNHSAYAYQEELSNGYVTMEGGHRVGICGSTVIENKRIKTIKDISSLNIRRSREIIGVSNPYIDYLLKDNKQIHNTIIVSPL